MGNANIDQNLKDEIEEILKKREYKIRYQNVKGFIDNACAKELDRIKNKKPKSI
jgi:metal-responsive CopG/Arc/MetJ family transcriptional regulator